MRNVVQQSFVVFTIGEKSYTVVYQKYMKENVVSSEISIQNKAEMSFQMKRHRTYFRTWGRPCRVSGDSDIGGYSLSAKTSVPWHYAELREYSPCRQNFGMSASCRVADTSYRSMQAPVQYIFLSNSFVCTYVFGYEKGHFFF